MPLLEVPQPFQIRLPRLFRTDPPEVFGHSRVVQHCCLLDHSNPAAYDERKYTRARGRPADLTDKTAPDKVPRRALPSPRALTSIGWSRVIRRGVFDESV
ncbi:hypothetical protein GCM10010286_05250 [Streptomyces toxytricini]|nr:hypothetical protein GCM10010286_05250 [Streptomyces toxytricini]